MLFLAFRKNFCRKDISRAAQVVHGSFKLAVSCKFDFFPYSLWSFPYKGIIS